LRLSVEYVYRPNFGNVKSRKI